MIDDGEVLVPDEVIPPEGQPPSSEEDPLRPLRERWRLLKIGLTIDALDFVIHLMPMIGLRIGFPLGLVAGFVIGRVFGWKPVRSLKLGIFIGIYLCLPVTRFVPLGVLFALLFGAG